MSEANPNPAVQAAIIRLAADIAAAVHEARSAGMAGHTIRQALLDAAAAIPGAHAAAMLAAIKAERQRRKDAGL